MNVEPKLVEEVDRLVKSEKIYSSRNEFIRDAIRSKVMEYRKVDLRRALGKIRQNALANGWNGEMPSKKEREKIAREHLKELGFSDKQISGLFD
jgi:Arc/MetJ-type ribon-helix-helix transcriptional regulator